MGAEMILRKGLGKQEERQEEGACGQKRNESNLIFFSLFFSCTFFFNLFSLSLPMLKVEVEQKGKRTVTNANP